MTLSTFAFMTETPESLHLASEQIDRQHPKGSRWWKLQRVGGVVMGVDSVPGLTSG